MDFCFYDYETFWSVQHSLTKTNPIDYVMHEETELQVLTIAFNDSPVSFWLGEDMILSRLEALQKAGAFDNCMLVAHNGSGFDHMITRWRTAVRPKAYGCTLAMARPLYALTCGVSLAKVAVAEGAGVKGSLDAVNTKGLKVAQFTKEQIRMMRQYAGQDTELCRKIFYSMLPRLPKGEMQLIDKCIRMTVEPQIMANTPLMLNALNEEIKRKELALIQLASLCGGSMDNMRDTVMSQPKFAGLLTSLGAQIPMKESKTTPGKMIPALAKTDKGLEALLENDDYRVQVAAATRMEVKSTQLETRLKTFLTVADRCGGYLPMPVNYCGAAISWRMSGGLKMNVQNQPRVDGNDPKPSDALRHGLIAPPGYKIVVVDSSNIELRVAHLLAGQWDTVEKLRNKEDLYCWFASNLFGRPVTKKDVDDRFIGKVAMLSLQYGASWAAFQNMVRILSKGKTLLDERECRRIVDVWRGMFGAISGKKNGIWKKCDNAIDAMFKGITMQVDEHGLITTEHEKLLTPTGHWLSYPHLRKNMGDNGYDEWLYGDGWNKSRIYGAHLFENLCLCNNTNVLTLSGWKFIVDVSAQDKLWDGVEWVAHSGLVSKGTQRTINFGGVWMTPNHEVLVDENWIEAHATTYAEATSSFDRHYWIPFGQAASDSLCRQRRQEIFVGGALRLRIKNIYASFKAHAKNSCSTVMRVREGESVKRSSNIARYVVSSGIRRVSQHVGSLRTTVTPSVQKLRGAWHNGMQTVAGFVHKVLGRHGAFVRAGVDAGQNQQQSGVQQSKLQVGDASSASTKHKGNYQYPNATGHDADVESGGVVWFKQEHYLLQGETRMAGVADIRAAEQTEVESREEPVYDLLNAGPRHRFTVRGADGRAFLVHNCQHIARLVVMEQTMKLDRRYPVALSCHDEAVTVVKDEYAEEASAYGVEVFSRSPVWWPSLPLAAEAGIGDTYGQAK